MAERGYYRREVIELLELRDGFLEQIEEEELVYSVQETTSPDDPVYPVEQVERIRIIRNLVQDLEVNLHGCGVILEMRENMIRMQQNFDQILRELAERLRGRV
jgi:DNA-binding transcriptional MerR regulator